jgi:hypothetical protein
VYFCLAFGRKRYHFLQPKFTAMQVTSTYFHETELSGVPIEAIIRITGTYHPETYSTRDEPGDPAHFTDVEWQVIGPCEHFADIVLAEVLEDHPGKDLEHIFTAELAEHNDYSDYDDCNLDDYSDEYECGAAIPMDFCNFDWTA